MPYRRAELDKEDIIMSSAYERHSLDEMQLLYTDVMYHKV